MISCAAHNIIDSAITKLYSSLENRVENVQHSAHIMYTHLLLGQAPHEHWLQLWSDLVPNKFRLRARSTTNFKMWPQARPFSIQTLFYSSSGKYSTAMEEPHWLSLCTYQCIAPPTPLLAKGGDLISFWPINMPWIRRIWSIFPTYRVKIYSPKRVIWS